MVTTVCSTPQRRYTNKNDSPKQRLVVAQVFDALAGFELAPLAEAREQPQRRAADWPRCLQYLSRDPAPLHTAAH